MMNILIIMSDQHHRNYMGCAGHPVVQTPNMDRLALEGTRFSETYCPSPLCGPSRMSFLSALHPCRTGVYANAQPLPSDIPTFAHSLGALGYDTAIAGRMHFTGFDLTHGFEERLCGDVTASTLGGGKVPCLDGLDPGTGPKALKLSGPGDSAYLHYDEVVTEASCEWLRQRPSGRLFCLTVGLALPHNPFVCDPEDYAAYAGHWKKPSRLECEHPAARRRREAIFGSGQVTDEDEARAWAAYCGLVTATDRRVGRLLDQLESQGVLDDTLVVYTSDHGEMAGEHGLWFKTVLYEGSAGVPLLMRLPGTIPAGKTLQGPVNLIDLTATLLDLAGAPDLPMMDGRSLRGIWEGAEAPGQRTVFSEYGTRWGTPELCRMVRQGRWKYIYHDRAEDELFDLTEDPEERLNRAQDPVCRELRDKFLSVILDGWNPADINRGMDLWKSRNRVIFDWFASRAREDCDLYQGPAGCNRLDAVPDFKPAPDERFGMY